MSSERRAVELVLLTEVSEMLVGRTGASHGTMTGWTIKSSGLGPHYIDDCSIANLQSHMFIPYVHDVRQSTLSVGTPSHQKMLVLAASPKTCSYGLIYRPGREDSLSSSQQPNYRPTCLIAQTNRTKCASSAFKGVHPEYLMWLSDIGYKWQTHFTFQLAYNPVDCYYGALTVCVNKYPDLVCSAGYMSHGGTGDNRFSEWHFKGDFYDVTVRLVHKADGEVTSWTIEHGALGNHNIKYVSLTNLQSHIVIPYFD
ncbi:uncharacterized protein L969DRAFT_94737 [Mixia osmundae IAM 14324]|uniref:uncharacterized protein n=1 Tax=Mixia osmundae (strain CBS 9802 / IAM 14324 / JCM 22182 / KY 12970) TaxID=764103 RepID=UPI0004A54657|nr:uncharacterized protein L969DRAFT_94737 [Mixia osmundae IAM 14324]KEI39689.1 hypothetical protein L969DRAFT_94737 [Mixia osmundae IAM 14324]